ncbi:cytosolic Fe-S cluster assembly factor nbp35 [Binucleata daphniae]
MVANNCPGVSHESAGKLDGCKDCPNQSYCKAEKTIDPDIALIKQNIGNNKKIFAVMSGKGGVGKSTVTRSIAENLSNKHKTLILDLDLAGPSIPRLTKTENNYIFETNNQILPVEVQHNIFCISIGHFEVKKGESMTSSTKTNIVKKILKHCDFSEFAYIIIDTPPGVTDEHLSIINYLTINGSILVCTPQSIALNDVIRQFDFCKKTNIKVIGLIENMKNYVCECGFENEIFSGTKVEDFCTKNEIDYLGAINIYSEIAKSGDKGVCYQNEKIQQIYDKIASKLL